MNEKQEFGRVIRGVGGTFTVLLPSKEQYSCPAKGILKRNDGKLLVGDAVSLRISEDGKECVIAQIHPRKNALIRPPLANVSYLLLVMAGRYPAPSLPMIDRLLAICVHEGIRPLLVVTKKDLASKEGEELSALYRKAGFPVFTVSSETGEGIDALRTHLKELLSDGEIAAFAGASGVGKSTLLTALFPALALQTGTLSVKTERGKHTTRHVELFPYAGGFLADTPGFSLLDFEHFDFFSLEDLLDAFPDFAPYVGACRYDDCTHTKEEGCALLDAIAAKKVAKTRHETYLALYTILKAKKNTYPKKPQK